MSIPMFLQGLFSCTFLILMIQIAYTDYKTLRISNQLCALLGLLGIFSIPVFPDIPLPDRLLGILTISLPLLIIALIIPGSFGGGDVKLMAAGGFFLGVSSIIQAFALAILTGGGYALFLLLIKKSGKHTSFAFGPFLCLGMILSFLDSGIFIVDFVS